MEEPTEIDKRYLEFLREMAQSTGESDRGLVLFSAAQIDHYLRRILEAFLIDDKSVGDLFDSPFAPFSTLSGKTRAAFAMGLISRAEGKRIDAVRRVRNIFAHEMDASFERDEVKELCAKPPIYDGRLCDRDAFLHMAMNTIPPLMYRDIRVRAEWKRAELCKEDAHAPTTDGSPHE
jgi:hypothetical protein